MICAFEEAGLESVRLPTTQTSAVIAINYLTSCKIIDGTITTSNTFTMADDSTNKNVESATAGVAEIRLDGKKNEISFLIM